MKLELKIHIHSDFHIASGEGLGRVVDSVVVTEQNGVPYVPASTLKGLTRFQVERLLELQPVCKMLDADIEKQLTLDDAHACAKTFAIEELFGGLGRDRGKVWFHDAKPEEYFESQIHGRSARDARTGRAEDGALFFYEDAAKGCFKGELTSDADLSLCHQLLLIMALRRIEYLGGQRRRGKGRVSVEVTARQTHSRIDGMTLPSNHADKFKSLLSEAFAGKLNVEESDAKPPSDRRSILTARTPRPTPTVASSVFLVAYSKGPITATNDPATENIIGALDYIPGSAVRGALASQLMRTSNWKPGSPLFKRTFNCEEVCFGPLYPMGSERLQTDQSVSFPMPASMHTCKYASGALDDASAVPHIHGLVNVLWLDKITRCERDNCHANLAPSGDFLQLIRRSNRVAFNAVAPEIRSFQRTEIDDVTQSSQTGRLYSTEAIVSGNWFAGYLWGSQELLQEIVNYVYGIPEQYCALRVGKSLTRGHGAIRLWAFGAVNEHSHYPALLPRDHDVATTVTRPSSNSDASNESDPMGLPSGSPNVDEFSLYLYSDFIGIDQYLRPVTRLDNTQLWRLLGGQNDAPFEICLGYSSTRRIGGFNGVPGLPRSMDIAITAGSVWRLKWKESATSQEKADAISKFKLAMSDGLGLRRGEGFGRIIFDLPALHCELNQPRSGNVLVDLTHEAKLPGVSVVASNEQIPRPNTRKSLDLSDELRTYAQKIPRKNRAALARAIVSMSDHDQPADAVRAAWERRQTDETALGNEQRSSEKKKAFDALTMEALSSHDFPDNLDDDPKKAWRGLEGEDQAWLWLFGRTHLERKNVKELRIILREFAKQLQKASSDQSRIESD